MGEYRVREQHGFLGVIDKPGELVRIFFKSGFGQIQRLYHGAAEHSVAAYPQTFCEKQARLTAKASARLQLD